MLCDKVAGDLPEETTISATAYRGYAKASEKAGLTHSADEIVVDFAIRVGSRPSLLDGNASFVTYQDARTDGSAVLEK